MTRKKYFEVGRLFRIVYTMRCGRQGCSKFLFPTTYTPACVAKELSAAPHFVKVNEVQQGELVFKIK